jgi:hypothetical protein
MAVETRKNRAQRELENLGKLNDEMDLAHGVRTMKVEPDGVTIRFKDDSSLQLVVTDKGQLEGKVV